MTVTDKDLNYGRYCEMKAQKPASNRQGRRRRYLSNGCEEQQPEEQTARSSRMATVSPTQGPTPYVKASAPLRRAAEAGVSVPVAGYCRVEAERPSREWVFHPHTFSGARRPGPAIRSVSVPGAPIIQTIGRDALLWPVSTRGLNLMSVSVEVRVGATH